MKDYPHIRDTVYPDLDTVDVYKIENKFDYSRWGVGTQVKLCNVRYNGDYKDVVKFAGDSERDTYFDNLAGRVVVLQTAFQQAPKDAIKIPLPYDTAIRYNYLFIDVPIPTTDAQPVDYANVDIAVKRYYYFIADIEQLAPNTSKVNIMLDVWTTYINDISIPYMMLERGHAPVAAVDTDSFLADPSSHSDLLLAPDVNYGDIGTTSYRNFHPIGNGHKLVCFMTTYSYTQITGFTAGADLPTGNDASYADETGRSGYRMEVNGYNYGMGGVDFSESTPVPVQAYDVNYQEDVPSLFCYGVACEDAASFFSYLSRRCPQIMESVTGCFVLGEDVATVYDPFNFNGITLYKLKPRTLAFGLHLAKNMFGYPRVYERYTKLFTYPYAQLEISDNDNHTFTIRIEDICNSSHLETVLNLAAPYLHYQTIALDIAGYGNSQDYIWSRIDGVQKSIDAPFASFEEYMIEWDIPVYALYERGYDDYRLHHFWQMQLTHDNAITNYRAAQRNVNTTDANTHDTNATNVTNTANSQNTIVNNNNVAIAAAVANQSESQNCTAYNIQNIHAQQDANYTSDCDLMDQTTEANNDYAKLQTIATNTQNAQNAAEGALSSALHGDILSTVFSVGNGITGNLSTNMMYQAGVHLAALTNSLTQIQMYEHKYNAQEVEATNFGNTSYMARTIMSNSNTAQTTQVNNNRTTTNTNANNTANTSNANADYTRHSQFLANAAQMTLAQRGQIFDYRGQEFAGQIQRGVYANDPKLDVQQRRGIAVRVKTQRQSDIAQAAAQFARFGYNLNQVWDMSQGLTLMKNFTYWQASDIWVVDDKGTPNTVQLNLQDIFTTGVTVWDDPDKIGAVSVYDN